MEVRYITNSAKIYPDMIKIIIYNEPKAVPVGYRQRGKREKKENYIPSTRSIMRTRQNLQDLVKCNRFELFCTFTFDRRKIDRYNLNACYLAMSKWLHNQKALNSPALAYVIVPERHKDGAIHFHALINGFCGRLKPSGHFQNGREVFNITGYRSGFSTAVKIDNVDKVSSYVRKYITKDMVKDFGRRRYFASRNLIRPVKQTNTNYFEDCLPFGRKEVFEGSDFTIYELDPHFCQKVLDKKLASNYINNIPPFKNSVMSHNV